MPEEFENRGFTLKIHQMFSVHTILGVFKNTIITCHFGFMFKGNSAIDNCNYIVFKNYSVHKKMKTLLYLILWFEEHKAQNNLWTAAVMLTGQSNFSLGLGRTCAKFLNLPAKKLQKI